MQCITKYNLSQDDKIKTIKLLEKNNLFLKEWENEEISYILNDSDLKLDSLKEWSDIEIHRIKL